MNNQGDKWCLPSAILSPHCLPPYRSVPAKPQTKNKMKNGPFAKPFHDCLPPNSNPGPQHSSRVIYKYATPPLHVRSFRSWLLGQHVILDHSSSAPKTIVKIKNWISIPSFGSLRLFSQMKRLMGDTKSTPC